MSDSFKYRAYLIKFINTIFSIQYNSYKPQSGIIWVKFAESINRTIISYRIIWNRKFQNVGNFKVFISQTIISGSWIESIWFCFTIWRVFITSVSSKYVWKFFWKKNRPQNSHFMFQLSWIRQIITSKQTSLDLCYGKQRIIIIFHFIFRTIYLFGTVQNSSLLLRLEISKSHSRRYLEVVKY